VQAGRTFTDTFLRHLRPQAKRYDVTDPGRRGFQVRVFPSGQKSFQFRYHHHGITRRLTLGPYPAVALAEAHFAHAEAVKLLSLGRDPFTIRLSAREQDTSAGTVGELAEEFVQRYVLRQHKHPEQVQQMLDANVLLHWRRRRAQDITPRDVTLLLDRIVDRGSPIMANRVAATVSQMFKFGVQRGLLNASPCVALQRPGGREKSRERILTEDEVLTVWQRLDEANMTVATKTAMRLLLVTAQRRGELARAQWADIDFTTALWTIPAEHAKNGRTHRVPLSSLALDLLNELKTRGTGTVWLFPSAKQNGSAMIEQSLSRAVRNNEEHFGIPHFTLHDFRRTAASMMTMLGIPRLHVSKVLNHADEGITAVYDRHDYLPEMRKALETWADYLAAIVSGRACKIVPIDYTARERALTHG
jgi:integrase